MSPATTCSWPRPTARPTRPTATPAPAASPGHARSAHRLPRRLSPAPTHDRPGTSAEVPGRIVSCRGARSATRPEPCPSGPDGSVRASDADREAAVARLQTARRRGADRPRRVRPARGRRLRGGDDGRARRPARRPARRTRPRRSRSSGAGRRRSCAASSATSGCRGARRRRSGRAPSSATSGSTCAACGPARTGWSSSCPRSSATWRSSCPRGWTPSWTAGRCSATGRPTSRRCRGWRARRWSSSTRRRCSVTSGCAAWRRGSPPAAGAR